MINKAIQTFSRNLEFSVDDAAAVHEYNLDTEIRYRDVLDNSQVSDSFSVPVEVIQKPASAGLVKALSTIVIIALIGAGAGYYVLVVRKRK